MDRPGLSIDGDLLHCVLTVLRTTAIFPCEATENLSSYLARRPMLFLRVIRFLLPATFLRANLTLTDPSLLQSESVLELLLSAKRERAPTAYSTIIQRECL
jgi:hypothetical protein